MWISARRLRTFGELICMVAVLLMALPAGAQSPGTNQWTWMSGSSTLPLAGFLPAVYGTLGTPAAANTPGSRTQAAGWTGSDGRLWLFGGFNFDEQLRLFYYNDLWEFDPSTDEWAWMGGSNTPAANCPTIEQNITCGAAGVYGAQGTAAAGNWPGGRYSTATWVGAAGRLWLYGGWGLDAKNQVGILGDLWVFDPATGQWTWTGGDSTLPVSGENDLGVYGILGEPAAGNYPGSLTFASEATDPSGNTWIFGGWGFNNNNQNSLPNKLWEFVQSTGDWGWMAGPVVTNPDFAPPFMEPRAWLRPAIRPAAGGMSTPGRTRTATFGPSAATAWTMLALAACSTSYGGSTLRPTSGLGWRDRNC